MNVQIKYATPQGTDCSARLLAVQEGASWDTDFGLTVTARSLPETRAVQLSFVPREGQPPVITPVEDGDQPRRQLADDFVTVSEWRGVLLDSRVRLRAEGEAVVATITIPESSIDGKSDAFLAGLLNLADSLLAGAMQQLLQCGIERTSVE